MAALQTSHSLCPAAFELVRSAYEREHGVRFRFGRDDLRGRDALSAGNCNQTEFRYLVGIKSGDEYIPVSWIELASDFRADSPYHSPYEKARILHARNQDLIEHGVVRW